MYVSLRARKKLICVWTQVAVRDRLFEFSTADISAPTLDVLCLFNFSILFYRSPQKDALESPISDNYFNFALLSLWNLLFYF